jgi:hypothetical protein
MLELLVALLAGTTVAANTLYMIEVKRNNRLQDKLLGLCDALAKDLKISNERHDQTAEKLARELGRVGQARDIPHGLSPEELEAERKEDEAWAWLQEKGDG